MLRNCLFCLVLLLAAGAGYAQKVPYYSLAADSGRMYLRHSPLGLIDPLDGNFTVGTEYRFNREWSATMDAGVIFYSRYFGKTKQATGILLRPGVRLYPGKYKDYFVEFQLHYKAVMYRIKDWIDRDVVQGVASYEELTTFRYKKRVMGMQIMGGMKQYIGNSRRFFIEIYLGLGVHFKNQNLVDEPNGRYDPPFSLSIIDNTTNTAGNAQANTPVERTVVPSVPGGIRLTYRIF